MANNHSNQPSMTRRRLLTASVAAFGGAILLDSSPALAVGNYSNDRIADIALSRIGQWGGQCKRFVNHVVSDASGGSQWPAPGYHSGFQGAGGVQVNTANARKGDIIQVGNSDYDWPLHTTIVVENQGGGNFWVVDSNWGTNEIVSQHSFSMSWGNGSDARIWRMGKVSSGGSGWGGVGNATFRGSDTLTEGQQLHSNEYILSADGRFVLMMQTDGNLVLRGPGGKAIWASDTGGHSGAYLIMQSDGNMVIYRSGTALWASDTSSVKRLVMQTDGNLVARNALSGGGAVWASNTVKGSPWSYKGGDTLAKGQGLNAGQYLRSANKTRFAIMQNDGNFLLYGPGYMPYWATDTSGYSNAHLDVQDDGNVVLYAGGSPRWATDTRNVATLTIQHDGNLVARTTSNSAVWASNTVN